MRDLAIMRLIAQPDLVIRFGSSCLMENKKVSGAIV